jgi:hypothetical protein
METVQDIVSDKNAESKGDNGDFSSSTTTHDDGLSTRGLRGELSRANKILDRINNTRNSIGTGTARREKPLPKATSAQAPMPPFPSEHIWSYGLAEASQPDSRGGDMQDKRPKSPDKEVPTPDLPIAEKLPDSLPIGRPLPAYPPTPVPHQTGQVWLKNGRIAPKQDASRPGLVRDGCSRDREWAAAGRSSWRHKREKTVPKPQPLPQTWEGVKLQNEEPDAQKIHVSVDKFGRRFVVLMIHRCGRGPGLLPVTGFSGEIVWLAPPDVHITLTKYMHQFLGYFTGESWEERIIDVFDGNFLPRYQCAVKQEDWRLAWDTLQEPFVLMCAAYRRILGGKSAPHLRFGVPPRSVEDKATSVADSSSVNGQSLSGFTNAVTIPDTSDYAAGMRANFELLSQVDTGIAAHLLNILASTSGEMVADSMQRQVEELHKQLSGGQGDRGGIPLGMFPFDASGKFPFDASGKNLITTAGTSMIQSSIRPEQPFMGHFQAVPPNN